MPKAHEKKRKISYTACNKCRTNILNELNNKTKIKSMDP